MAMRAGAFSVAALVLLGVAGCAPTPAQPAAEPTSSRAPSPTPTPTPAAVPGLLVLDADGFSVRTADGVELDAFTYLDDPTTVVDALTDVLGSEPAVSQDPGDDTCAFAATIYAWDEAVLVVEDDNYSPTYKIGTTADANGDVQMETAAGARVGASFEDFLATIPDMPRQLIDYEGERYGYALESVSSYTPDGHTEEDSLGVRIMARNGVIDGFAAPSLMNNPC